MISGTYKITMSTPIGQKSGTLSLMEAGGSLSGSINFQGSVSDFSGGTVNGNNFEFGGTLKIGYTGFRYHARGSVEGDTLKATASTQFGNMPIRGTRG